MPVTRTGMTMWDIVAADRAAAMDDHLLLDNVAVDPALHGRGLGRTLIAFAKREALRRGYREVRVYTHEAMAENLAMYPVLGWQETGRSVRARRLQTARGGARMQDAFSRTDPHGYHSFQRYDIQAETRTSKAGRLDDG